MLNGYNVGHYSKEYIVVAVALYPIGCCSREASHCSGDSRVCGHCWVLLGAAAEKSLATAPILSITGRCYALQQRKVSL